MAVAVSIPAAAVSLVLLLFSLLLVTPASVSANPASTTSTVGSGDASPALTVTLDSLMTQVGDSAALTVSGDALAALHGDATIEVRLAGPASLSQLGEKSPVLPGVSAFSATTGSLPAAARPAVGQVHLPLPLANLPAAPGAYRVTVDVTSEGGLVASGSTWMGRVVPRSSPLDLGFVWRMELGIHRDEQGRFFDSTLELACAPGAGLPALAGLTSRYPDWRFSLGIEPVLLTQLRDMADGFVRVDGSPSGMVVDASGQPALDAKTVLSSLTAAADAGSVEVAAAPYSGPDLGLLGTEDWRDGLEQIQLGKEEVTQTLLMGMPPSGAFSPGLDITSKSMGDYGQSSIDHVLVDAAVSAGIEEGSPQDAVAVRVHDEANDRVTLVLADSDLRALIADPWDPAVLFAGIAAVLAAGDRDALVLTQAADFTTPPQSYLDAIGEELKRDTWVRTQTMSDLLLSHPPGTRPLLLTRDPAPPTGYIAPTVFDAVRNAHASVEDLASTAGPANLALEAARRSLFIAESRWWQRPGVSPDEASIGLAYAVLAERTAKDPLSKIGVSKVGGGLIFGREGIARVTVTNGGQSVMTVGFTLEGEGLTLRGGSSSELRLQPGDTTVDVAVVGTSGEGTLTARLTAGRSVLAEKSASLHFVTVVTFLPWAGLAVLVVILIIMTTILIRRRRLVRR